MFLREKKRKDAIQSLMGKGREQKTGKSNQLVLVILPYTHPDRLIRNPKKESSSYPKAAES